MATGWTEADSGRFIDYGKYFVPDREAQIDTICGLIPPAADGATLVELCCGAGLLSAALLARFPAARVLAFDGSPRMLASVRAMAGAGAAAAAARLETREFDLADTAWRHFDRPAHAVVSSLAIHHLDGPGKRRLYADMAAALAPGGALVIADLVAPASAAGVKLAADAWDAAVRQRALEIDGNLDAFAEFRALGWNYYADPEPDPIDQPSALFDQLHWLAEAGLEAVDVHWMRAGHAIFGGRKPGGPADV